MSLISREWLLHGCMNLGDDQIEPASRAIRRRISAMHNGGEFAIKGWPQRAFREVIWWYEKQEIPSNVASYFLRVENSRGPNLYAGVTVEKGFEDPGLAGKTATQKNEPLQRWLLGNGWDWQRLISSPLQTMSHIVEGSRSLHKELYLWLEFGDERQDSRYYIVKDRELYWRGGFAPVPWEELFSFATQPRPQLWGSMNVARAFSLDECSPYLDEEKIVEVFQALRPLRELWRGRALL